MEYIELQSQLFIVLSIICLSTFVVPLVNGAAVLPDSEVEGLRSIARRLGKTDWNFSVDPCSGESGWTTLIPVSARGAANAVICDCSYVNSTVCHVVSMLLRMQSLPGILAPEFAQLPYLQELDLTRNYLNGSIPREWSSLPLVNLSLIGNRISGPIPVEFTNITTLRDFTLEYNQVSGSLPAEFGNLVNIERILISCNNFTGPLPETLARLTNLRDFRISDNHFNGKIPNFIQNWTKLEKIAIQASGLQGPIPLGISTLAKITDMRISDVNGTDTPFPQLSNMEGLHTLVLKSCNIIGVLPAYLGNLSKLRNLDLSFNKLTGPIPSNFENLLMVDYMYLTGNKLTGPVPEWMLTNGDNIDLSYNDFTLGSSSEPNCQQRNINLFGSSFSGDNSAGNFPCLRSFRCPRDFYQLHINCGGREVSTSRNTTYGDDIDPAGASNFYLSRHNWASSTTGNFLDNPNDIDMYIATNTSMLSTNSSQLYTTARLSPLSLTYYGLCLLNGNYTVNLHFAEIIFTDDRTYRSLGKRIFDVYIQGKLVLKDFNIVDEAGGVEKVVIKNFTAIVTNSRLEIRLYWAGRGTTGIPFRGTYGPLISAISVNPDFEPPKEDGRNMSPGLVAGIVLLAVGAILVILCVLWWKGCIRQKKEIHEDQISPELRGLDLQTGTFTLRQIKAATKNFDPANKIGEGGFGAVFKGHLSDGTIIAVKQLSSKSNQGNCEFVNEIGMISGLQHPNLVRLYGCCVEGNQLLLIYEYLENNSLARALFESEDSQLKLDWPTRKKICVGVARALAYLHEESRLKIVHRDIKASNILLDKDLNSKVSDFGLAKLDENDKTHISTRIAGTYGYMAPEYAMKGYLTDKADVYSFGIVTLEIISGRSNTNFRPKEECIDLLDWALVLKEKGDLMDLVDPSLEATFVKDEVLGMINVALVCTNASPTLRPAMSSVVNMLEGRTPVQTSVSDSGNTLDDITKYKVIRDHYRHKQDQLIGDSQTHSMSIDGPWSESSLSATDHDPSSPDL